eukprot:CAMPEP_0175094836 /NCGR_PEP_ID=MMETSP0086_2-20121207/3817_1 /TAXON_ID=136419 /ORGANISM="Unknown Unknown, Strain D1" /LENGTH=114 /DNA_ID=CAMNT_0016368009 /DNA_START=80 /DNA_END=420 /DNA_ORIENTATION=-
MAIGVFSNRFNPFLQHKTCSLDVLLSCHEDQHISRRMRQVNRQGLFDSCVKIVLARGFGEHHVNLEGSSGDGEDRSVAKEVGKLFRVHGRAGDDDLEIAPLSGHLLEDAEQDVR